MTDPTFGAVEIKVTVLDRDIENPEDAKARLIAHLQQIYHYVRVDSAHVARKMREPGFTP
jgi:hypothetical protein